ncbi:MAG: hypothetical protein UR63_C0043G0009 [Candidatus Roizmanbacteria bacterium GW2011_GWC2_35_12]|uniref:Uncharacterized protein n=1 Tax=Candidatus Roizmanbacteria bacterium GW2011_GWC2_35_12 TaxID=1618485 RepID=A0A0G0B8U2_9BACT|nr:MAG: hypothetical protein UR63_C0043G0009 [Candidatus Roizmanbacteria bacterium GW2011_GWC2_35_12]
MLIINQDVILLKFTLLNLKYLMLKISNAKKTAKKKTLFDL